MTYHNKHNNKHNNNGYNNNPHNNYTSNLCLKTLNQKKERNETITYQEIFNALISESKFEKNYGNAETLFYMLLERLNKGRPVKNYIADEITVFQKAITTMIRYAPNPQRALDFTAYLLKQDPPLRTVHVETTALINLIFVYSCEGSPDSMEKALELIKLGLERKAHKVVSHGRVERDNVGTVFVQVSMKVLRYHNLQISADESTLEPVRHRTTRPNRFSTY